MRHSTCTDCGSEFFCTGSRGPKPLRCPECIRALELKNQSEYSQRPESKRRSREYMKAYLEEYDQQPHVKAQERDRAFRKKYGITQEEYDRAKRDHGPNCDLCSRQVTQLLFDHDHQTGQFRGWLCHSCNTGLGQLGDDVEGLERARDYLLSAQSSTLQYHNSETVLGRQLRLSPSECCDLCRRDTSSSLDHDHTTGTVRGWLCITCNTGLGKLGDDLQSVEQALQYLAQSSLVLQ